MSYLLVLWGNGEGERLNHKVENLAETQGETRLTLGDGKFMVVTKTLTPEQARQYRKDVAAGIDPLLPIFGTDISQPPPAVGGENTGDPVGGGDGQV